MTEKIFLILKDDRPQTQEAQRNMVYTHTHTHTHTQLDSYIKLWNSKDQEKTLNAAREEDITYIHRNKRLKLQHTSNQK